MVEWMVELKVLWINGWMTKFINGLMNKINEWLNKSMKERKNSSMNGPMNEWFNEWMVQWMNEWLMWWGYLNYNIYILKLLYCRCMDASTINDLSSNDCLHVSAQSNWKCHSRTESGCS